MRFEFATANRIVFGHGALAQAGPIAATLGHHALVVVGGSRSRVDGLLVVLTSSGVTHSLFTVNGEPTVDLVAWGVDVARAAGCNLVISFGGGSVLDAGKAIAAMLTNEGEPLDYLEVVGRGHTITRQPAPNIAIPTTAGTGSEVTRNAVLGSPEHGVKASMRSPLMLPTVALVDPELTLSVPPAITATTGLDALTQLIEPYVGVRANPLTDALCLDGIPRAARALRKAWAYPNDAEAREEMSLVSLYGGLALANAGLGAVHGFAGPFGGMYSAPHGGICAALLPHVTAINVRALQARQPSGVALSRYAQIAKLLTGDEEAGADDAAPWLEKLVDGLEVPSLRRYGLDEDRFAELIQKAAAASSMKGNPIALTTGELEEILHLAL